MLDLSRFEGHTPGPWKRGENGGIKKANGVFGCVPHSSVWIEDAWYGNDATPESLANDALIAAAPELLAEVKRLREKYEPQ